MLALRFCGVAQPNCSECVFYFVESDKYTVLRPRRSDSRRIVANIHQHHPLCLSFNYRWLNRSNVDIFSFCVLLSSWLCIFTRIWSTFVKTKQHLQNFGHILVDFAKLWQHLTICLQYIICYLSFCDVSYCVLDFDSSYLMLCLVRYVLIPLDM